MSSFDWVAFAIVLVVSAARITRLLTVDSFPPTKALREEVQDWLDEGPRRRKWLDLTFCGWCLSFWVVLPLVIWADLAGVLDGKPAFGWSGDISVPFWWIANGIMAATYAAGWVMAHDGDKDED